ncbi:MAG TPA: bifunctional riboflavin kinase/FAD synthetase [Polyangia bacterium]
MHVIRGRHRISSQLGRLLRAPAVAIGNFDGVHHGHQALIVEAGRLGHAAGNEAVVLTFDPHPARFFAPTLAPPMLMSLDRRLELLGAAGADVVVVEPFTADFSALPAERFVAEVLRADLGARHVVVGYDFSFGARRMGNAALLKTLGAQLGMGVTIVQPVMVEGLVCSSTKIREFVLEGRVEGAALLLGRPYETTGPVVHGLHRGRTLGFPTANLESETELLPKPGVYAAWACSADGTRPDRWRAAVSIGSNPTFVAEGGTLPAVTVEAHLLDFEGDLYGTRLRLEYVGRLRDQRSFPSVDELLAEIKRDITRTRELLP